MKDKNQYSLEYLIEVFKEHEKEIEDSLKRSLIEDPEYSLKNDTFNLPKAFKTICRELLLLKKRKSL